VGCRADIQHRTGRLPRRRRDVPRRDPDRQPVCRRGAGRAGAPSLRPHPPPPSPCRRPRRGASWRRGHSGRVIHRNPAREPPAPIPVSVVTGFLGSGKTSLLNAMLHDGALADAVMIINEFGEIGIDHVLVETADEDIVEMASGCLCCTIRGDLINRLEDLLRRRDNGRIRPFTRVVIETTGLADPAPVLHTIMNHPYLVLRYRLDGVIAVVDAVNGQSTLDAHAEAVKQVAVADRLVLTK